MNEACECLRFLSCYLTENTALADAVVMRSFIHAFDAQMSHLEARINTLDFPANQDLDVLGLITWALLEVDMRRYLLLSRGEEIETSEPSKIGARVEALVQRLLGRAGAVRTVKALKDAVTNGGVVEDKSIELWARLINVARAQSDCTEQTRSHAVH